MSPRTGYPYLDAALDAPLAMAHRGGAGHPDRAGAENTAEAFRHAVKLGYTYLETDVHTTRDGVLVALHDAVLDRVTDRTGTVADLTWADLSTARIAGEYAVPRLVDLMEELPDARFNVDLKSVTSARPLADLVARLRAWDRVGVGSFERSRLTEFRRLTGGRVATSASPAEVALVKAGARAPGASMLQVPHRRGRLRVVTPGLVRRAHHAGMHVHVWTIDDPVEMTELLDLGVDGIVTDRTDLLRDVLLVRGQWRS